MSSQKVSIMLLILAFTLTLYNTGIILKRRKIKKDKDHKNYKNRGNKLFPGGI